MNRLELPPPPTARSYTSFPFPPAPRPGGPAPAFVPPRRPRRQTVVTLGVGLAMILVTGVAGVVASDRSKADRAPLFGGERSHSFIGRSADGDPFRWDPCSTIAYQIDPGKMGGWVVADVEEAVRRTGEATGLRFRFDGVVHTSVHDLLDDGSFVTDGAGGGLHWSPVLIAFRPRTAMRELGVRGALGVTFPVTSRFDADQFVSGAVVINTSAHLPRGFDLAPSVGTVVQHELGHAVGLGHILDPFQLMSPMPVVMDWGKGDLAGLHELGRGPCLDVPTAELHAAVVPLP
jgi:hypothetical protein